MKQSLVALFCKYSTRSVYWSTYVNWWACSSIVRSHGHSGLFWNNPVCYYYHCKRNYSCLKIIPVDLPWSFLIRIKTFILATFSLDGAGQKGDHRGAANTVASQEEGPGLNSDSGLSVWGSRVLQGPAWLLSRYSSFLPQSKAMQVFWIGYP